MLIVLFLTTKPRPSRLNLLVCYNCCCYLPPPPAEPFADADAATTGGGGGVSNGARQAAEDAAKEELCAICLGPLPNTGRAVIPCVSFRHLR